VGAWPPPPAVDPAPQVQPRAPIVVLPQIIQSPAPQQTHTPNKITSTPSWTGDNEVRRVLGARDRLEEASACSKKEDIVLPVESFTVERAAAMLEELITALSDPQLQSTLRIALARENTDEGRNRARYKLCKPLQSSIVRRYGFPAGSVGMSESVRALSREQVKSDPRVSTKMSNFSSLMNPGRSRGGDRRTVVGACVWV